MKFQPLPILFTLLLCYPMFASAQTTTESLPKAVNYWDNDQSFQQLMANDITVLTCSKSKKKGAYITTRGRDGVPLFIHPRCGQSNLMVSSFSHLSDPLKRFDSRRHQHVLSPGFTTLNPFVTTKYRERQEVFASFRFVTQNGIVKQQLYLR